MTAPSPQIAALLAACRQIYAACYASMARPHEEIHPAIGQLPGLIQAAEAAPIQPAPSISALTDALNLIRAEWRIPDHWWENSPESKPIRDYIAAVKAARSSVTLADIAELLPIDEQFTDEVSSMLAKMHAGRKSTPIQPAPGVGCGDKRMAKIINAVRDMATTWEHSENAPGLAKEILMIVDGGQP